jgi:hypothetical protein
MNSRIKELVEQAGMTLKPRRPYIDEEPDGYLESDMDYLDNNLEATRVFFEGGLERFAELIVRECAELIDNKEMITAAQTYDEVFVAKYDTKELCANQIREHFGVEE